MTGRTMALTLATVLLCAAGVVMSATTGRNSGSDCIPAVAEAHGQTSTTSSVGTETLPDLAFFTTSEFRVWEPYEACGLRVQLLNYRNGEKAMEGPNGLWAAWQLRASPNLDTVVAGSAMLHAAAPVIPDEASTGSIQVLTRSGSGWDEWDVASAVVGPSVLSGIEIMPDDDTLLVATGGWTWPRQWQWTGPFRLESFSLADMVELGSPSRNSPTHRLGEPIAVVELPHPVVAMDASPDGSTVHVTTVSSDGTLKLRVYTLDVPTMTLAGAPIELPAPASTQEWPTNMSVMTDLSTDGNTLVVTSGYWHEINVVDVGARRASAVEVPDAIAITDVSFSHGPSNDGLVALSIRRPLDAAAGPPPRLALATSQVLVGELLPEPSLVERGRGPLLWSSGLPGAVDWTGGGTGIVAGIDWLGPSENAPPWRPIAYTLEVNDGARSIAHVRDLNPCADASYVADILTGNGHMPPPTATPSPTSEPSPTPTVTPTPAVASSATPTPTSTPDPEPIFLPVSLSEECLPEKRRADVVLVVDASTTMLEGTGRGRTKLAAAVAAVGVFLDQLDLDAGDQAALVSFNVDATLHEALTDDRARLDSALSRIAAAELTRIHLGVEMARSELASSRHRPENTAVMIVLTDGRSNPDPVDLALDQARMARDEGVVLFTVGLGSGLDEEALRGMASTPDGYYHAPTADQLAQIYRQIAVEIPCPRSAFWGRRW